MTKPIEVRYGETRRYPVYVDMDIWKPFHRFCRDRYSSRRLFLVIDSKVAGYHGEMIEKECRRYFDDCISWKVPEGESSKSMAQWNELADFLLKHDIERSTPVLAAGGGVTGDLAGFAAATVLRGVPLIHMPTSLLAMVDSSIGGKTGINHEAGKNLIGSFYQPDAVFAHLPFLETLERAEWINGLAEILKYAAIREPLIFNELNDLLSGEGFAPGPGWAGLIGKCAAIKARIVSSDMLESGERAHLNFGHTFAHALEKISGYGNISHGQAVFVGMFAALHASKRQGAPVADARFSPFRSLYPLELDKTGAQIDTLIDTMNSDKKVKHGTVRLVLLKDWGNPYLYACDDRQLLEDSWRYALDKFK